MQTQNEMKTLLGILPDWAIKDSVSRTRIGPFALDNGLLLELDSTQRLYGDFKVSKCLARLGRNLNGFSWCFSTLSGVELERTVVTRTFTYVHHESSRLIDQTFEF